MTESCWVLPFLEQNPESEHWGLSYAMMLRCTSVLSWWKVMRKAFDGKIADGVIHCSMWELSAPVGFLSFLPGSVSEQQGGISSFTSPRNSEVRETKIHLAIAQDKMAWNFQAYPQCQQGLMFVKVEIRLVGSIIRRVGHVSSFPLSKDGCSFTRVIFCLFLIILLCLFLWTFPLFLLFFILTFPFFFHHKNSFFLSHFSFLIQTFCITCISSLINKMKTQTKTSSKDHTNLNFKLIYLFHKRCFLRGMCIHTCVSVL